MVEIALHQCFVAGFATEASGVKVQFNNSICQVLTSTPTSITVVTSGLRGNMTAGTPHTLQLGPSQVCCHEHSQCALQSPLLVTVRAL